MPDAEPRWPEYEAQGEIDGIVGPYAIEHTSVHAQPEGKAPDDRFKKVIGELEKEFDSNLGFPLPESVAPQRNGLEHR